MQNLEASVMVLPSGRIPFQHGYVDASDHLTGRVANQNAALTVRFGQRFKEPPKVVVWFTEISEPHTRKYLKTYTSDVTTEKMIVNIDTWGNAVFEAARVAWLAWPAEYDGKLIRAANDQFNKGARGRTRRLGTTAALAKSQRCLLVSTTLTFRGIQLSQVLCRRLGSTSGRPRTGYGGMKERAVKR
ncbi:hypothetical protein V8C34DRAFT_280867 [Trichoderma compactum]